MRELNAILEYNLVLGAKGHLRTFAAIQWESELSDERPNALCYPFDLPIHRFQGKTLLVKRPSGYLVYDIIVSIAYFILVLM